MSNLKPVWATIFKTGVVKKPGTVKDGKLASPGANESKAYNFFNLTAKARRWLACPAVFPDKTEYDRAAEEWPRTNAGRAAHISSSGGPTMTGALRSAPG
jgi:hypothetical protein